MSATAPAPASVADPSSAQVRVVDEGVVTELVIDRDDKRNSLSAAVVEGLIDGVAHAVDRGARLLVLRGEGRCFSAGFDLSALPTSTDGDLLLRFVRIERLLADLESAPMTTLALVHGRTFGAGADLAMACTHRVLDPAARLRMPGLRFGLVLGTRRLAALTGRDFAHRMLQSSQTIEADLALEVGMATAVVPQDAWAQVREDLSETTTQLTPAATRAMRRALATHDADADLAALVRSASEPGLGDRIRRYQQEAR